MINTLYSEYPFGDLLVDSKFDELSEYLQSHYQYTNTGDSLAEGNIPMHDLVFSCW